MNITFFKKKNDPAIELIKDLIDELDELYKDLAVELKYMDGKDETYVSIFDTINIREETIKLLCMQHSANTSNKSLNLLN